MSTTEFCVYNQTRASFLTSRVTVIDAQSEPLKAVKVLIEGLAPDASAGLWLNPLKSIPTAPRLSAYDLVYLDREGRVVHCAELVPDEEAPRFDGAASALVLPVHTFAASQTLPGDRVILRPVDEQPPAFAPVATASATTMVAAGSRLVESSRVESVSTIVAPEAAISAGTQESAAQTRAIFTAIQRLQPLAWSLPSAPAQPLSALAPAQSMTAQAEAQSLDAPKYAPKTSQSRFELLRSIVHLRIRVQVSISTAPPAISNPTPATVTVAAHTTPDRLLRLGFSRAAVRSQVAATARSCSTVWSALVRRISRFVTVAMPVFEYTIPAGVTHLRRTALASYSGAKTRYLLWADAFMFRPADASPVPRIFRLHPARRDRH